MRYVDIDRDVILRAARLARLPGVRRAEACARFSLSIGALRRAMKEMGARAWPSSRDLVLHTLTDGGTRRAGTLPRDLRLVASYLDYVNKDAATEDDVRGYLDELVRERVIAIDGTRFRLLQDFP